MQSEVFNFWPSHLQSVTCHLKNKNRSLLNGLYLSEYVSLRGKSFLQEVNFQRV